MSDASTPIAAVSAYAQLFELGAKDRPEDLARSMEGIQRETARMRDPGREVPVPESSGSQLLIGLVSPGTSPSDKFARGELEERVNCVVALLPASDQELLRLRYYEGWAWSSSSGDPILLLPPGREANCVERSQSHHGPRPFAFVEPR